MRFRTGLPLFPPNSTCRACWQPMDDHGDHSLCCPARCMYRRHNRVRDYLFQAMNKAGWSPEVEVALPNSGDRPADILCKTTFSKPLAIDVTISHPLRISAPEAVRGEATASAKAAESAKRQTSASACHAAGWAFRPMGFETTGGFGPGASKTVQQLYRQLSMKNGQAATIVREDISRQLSLALAKGRGEMLSASFPDPTGL